MDATPGAAPLVPVLPTHRFDEAALVRFLQDRLPGFADGAPEVQQFQGGQSNPTFHLAAGGHRYVLRKKPPGALLPSAHAVEREFAVMRALRGTEVPVPGMRLLCEDAEVIGTPFYVMDHVEGRVFAGRLLTALPLAEGVAMHDDMARVLAALHRLEPAALGLAGFGRPENYLARQVTRWSRQYAAARTGEDPDMDRLMAWLPHHLPADEAAAIVHGDYRLGNLVFRPAEPRVAAVLDWELATLGHPLADLAYCCLTWRMPPEIGGVHGADPATHGLPPEENFVARYCASAGRAVPAELDVFVVFSMFRLAAISAGVYRRALDGNAADRGALGHGDRCRRLAARAWEIARGLDG